MGEPQGKITLFFRKNKHAPQEGKGGGSDHGLYTGIDYFYIQDESSWVNTESGYCAAEESQVLGTKAFKAAGI